MSGFDYEKSKTNPFCIRENIMKKFNKINKTRANIQILLKNLEQVSKTEDLKNRLLERFRLLYNIKLFMIMSEKLE
ncbi:hypothetical protein H311_01525 [Anncaliia algerae PRA109]|nr:hypothetical protein H311_01525 [Anncaliia algerae PRA109]